MQLHPCKSMTLQTDIKHKVNCYQGPFHSFNNIEQFMRKNKSEVINICATIIAVVFCLFTIFYWNYTTVLYERYDYMCVHMQCVCVCMRVCPGA